MVDQGVEMETLVRELLGECNGALSDVGRGELRFGRHGSLSVKVPPHPRAGVWFDYEAWEGGGVAEFRARYGGAGAPVDVYAGPVRSVGQGSAPERPVDTGVLAGRLWGRGEASAARGGASGAEVAGPAWSVAGGGAGDAGAAVGMGRGWRRRQVAGPVCLAGCLGLGVAGGAGAAGCAADTGGRERESRWCEEVAGAHEGWGDDNRAAVGGRGAAGGGVRGCGRWTGAIDRRVSGGRGGLWDRRDDRRRPEWAGGLSGWIRRGSGYLGGPGSGDGGCEEGAWCAAGGQGCVCAAACGPGCGGRRGGAAGGGGGGRTWRLGRSRLGWRHWNAWRITRLASAWRCCIQGGRGGTCGRGLGWRPGVWANRKMCSKERVA